MLPLEISYAFDPIPPEPDMATPMSRSSLSEAEGDDAGDLAFANALDLGSTPLGCDRLDDDWTLAASQAHHVLGGQVRMHWSCIQSRRHHTAYGMAVCAAHFDSILPACPPRLSCRDGPNAGSISSDASVLS